MTSARTGSLDTSAENDDHESTLHHRRHLALLGYDTPLQTLINVERAVLRVLGHRDAPVLLELGSNLIQAYLVSKGNIAYLQEAIPLGREARERLPDEYPGLYETCLSFGFALWWRFYRTSDTTTRSHAIYFLQEAIKVRPDDAPEESITFQQLSFALLHQFEQTKELTCIEDSMRYAHKALDLRPEGESERDVTLHHLGLLHSSMYRAKGQRVDLEAAIKFASDALELRPEGNPLRHDTLSQLAMFRIDFFSLTRDLSSLETAIPLAKEALALQPAGHRNHGTTAMNVALAYDERYSVKDDLEDMEQATRYATEALAAFPPGDARRHSVLDNLARYHLNLYMRTGKYDSLVTSISLGREALQLRPKGHPQRHVTLTNHANAVRSHHKLKGDLASLDEGIECSIEALENMAKDDPSRGIILVNLARNLNDRNRATGESESLEQAIEMSKEALRFMKKEDEGYGAALDVLAQSLCLHSELTGRLESLEAAIDASRRAVAARSGHRTQLHAVQELGYYLNQRYVRTQDRVALDEATQLFKEGLDLSPPGHIGRPTMLINLANCHTHLYSLEEKADDLAVIIRCNEEVLQLSDTHSIKDAFLSHINLAWAHARLGTRYYDLPKAIGHLSKAAKSPTGSARLRLMQLWPYVAQYEDLLSSYKQRDARNAGAELLDVYEQLIRLVPYVAYFGLDLPHRLETLKHSESLGLAAAVLALQVSLPSQAIELLEEARGVFWAQSLYLRSPLDALPRPVATELTDLFKALEDGGNKEKSSALPAWSDKDPAIRRRMSERVEELIMQIREMPGLGRFMLGPTFSVLSVVAAHGPVVVLLAYKSSCEALAIMDANGTINRILLPSLSVESLRELTGAVRESNSRAVSQMRDGAATRPMGVSRPRKKDKDDHLGKLWKHIVKPVVAALGVKKSNGRNRPRIHLCPTGPFAFLPLHAAGLEGSGPEWLSDYVVTSYTPTLTALLKARQRRLPLLTAKLTPLLVAEAFAPKLPAIENVMDEVLSVAKVLAPTSPVVVGQTSFVGASIGSTVEAVLDELIRASILHLACHGQQHPTNPLQSGFRLRNGTLSVAALMRLHLPNAVLAFLSACETAKGEQTQPDQAVHLAATMLFVGFQSVIATMWEMGDADGPFVAKCVYEEIMKDEIFDLDTVPYALDAAVRQLRKRGLAPSRWATFIHMGA